MTPAELPPVGFIGLGSQGAPMARKITEAGFPLTLWARRPETLVPFADTAAEIASIRAELGAASEIVAICVVADTDVEQVVLGDHGVLAGMRPGGVVVVHSTIHPDTVRRLADAAATADVAVLDAPVSGGAPAVEEGRLLVMAAGDDTVLERCRPVFATFADPILHLGPLGSGQLAKLLNNLMFTAHAGAALDAFSLAESLAVDPAGLAAVLAHGSGGSRAADVIAALDFDPTVLAGSAGLLRKDVSIIRDLADARGGGLPPALEGLAERALEILDA